MVVVKDPVDPKAPRIAATKTERLIETAIKKIRRDDEASFSLGLPSIQVEAQKQINSFPCSAVNAWQPISIGTFAQTMAYSRLKKQAT